MTSKEYAKTFISYYKVDGLMDFYRCSGRNLFYKKLLIYILREKFNLTYPQIAEMFKNNHTTIIYHYESIKDMPLLEESVENALKLYKEVA